MRLLITFAKIYPVRSTFMVLALLFAGILEGVGLSMLLPLFGIATGSQAGSEQQSAANSVLGRMVADGFATFNISPSLGVLLVVIIVAITLKSGLMLLAKKQVCFSFGPHPNVSLNEATLSRDDAPFLSSSEIFSSIAVS